MTRWELLPQPALDEFALALVVQNREGVFHIPTSRHIETRSRGTKNFGYESSTYEAERIKTKPNDSVSGVCQEPTLVPLFDHLVG